MPVENDELLNGDTAGSPVARRFRGYLPVVVDVETGGFIAASDALLEIAAVLLEPDPDGIWHPAGSLIKHVQPFEGARLDPAALEFNRIDPTHPFRKQIAVEEKDALQEIFTMVRRKIKVHGCKRAILVGHNAFFDLGFVNAAAERCGIKRNPFHPFSTLDTVTLAALAYGQTVLSRAVQAAGMTWNSDEAHSALYDAERTADLFCDIVNRWKVEPRD
ncbi:MAG: ribonuclease T [Gammaproteobacteria bacterium]|nr:ribonuclease T [Gammaproteobacteria bacterium]